MPKNAAKPILAVVGALASVAIGAGAGAYVVHNRESDRAQQISAIQAADAAQLAKLRAPVTAGARSDGSHYGSLFAYLLPMPGDWSPGPDVGLVGNNDYVSGSQIDTELQNSLLDVPKSDLSSTQSTLTNLHLQGIAVRSMANGNDTLQIDFQLLQLDPKLASSDQKALRLLVNGFGWRQGPSVPGYPSASCALPPGLGSDTLDAMLCIAAYGDIEVVVQAEGTVPLDQNTTVQMLTQQLNRLKSTQTLTASSADQGDQNE
ncbi:hypothetical protein KDK95_10935 [Actinospica sp. MGRD01-02]|uniref:Uncharacterized protein n=1 Tax=Actinospica acidithermotolerans TaxID=2828514 RepID=A0A941E931_9ACTN|nr:hypothetical protein [Actinospica acidithermotolerans]MBR7826817.1 hypothetical protein [Actinospica acidithermotolerans]